MSLFDSARRAILGDDYDYDDREYDEEYDGYEDEDEPPKRGFFSFFSRNRDEEYDDYEEERAPGRISARTASDRGSRDSSSYRTASSKSGYRTNISYGANPSGVEVTLITPMSFDDSSKIVKEVKDGKITIFDMSGMTDVDAARRIVDYICGAAEGMDCPFSRICPSVFCMAPKGVVLNGKKNRY